MHIERHKPGTLCWFELATTDQRAAKDFYQSLFGWEASESPIGPDEVYTIFKMHGRDVGAAYTMRAEQQSQGVPPNWGIYVAVDNADAMAERAQTLGATTLAPPFDVGDHGRMSVLQDPAGAVFSVWQPNKHIGTGVSGESHSVSWADLNTRDQAAAGAFYSDLFGWKMTMGKDMKPATPGSYYHIVNGSDFIGGVPPPGQGNPHVPPHWMIYIQVDDCAASTSKARNLGAATFVDSMAIGDDGWFSVLQDPQGAVFALHQSKKK
jgi:predicted enzyme related to lactoylglutathione lyase